MSKMSQTIGCIMKTLLKTDKNTYQYNNKFKNYKSYFIVDNRDEVVNYMRENNEVNNSGHRRKTVKSFDFSTLYTSIPHDELIDKMSKFICKIFEIKAQDNKKFITISKQQAYFSINRSKKCLSLSCQELIDLVKFLIDNSYVVYKGKVFRQITGIPMGTNCAPYLANIFLHVYEYLFIAKCIEDGNDNIANALAGLFRYQDDCIVFDDDNVFADNINNIYPSSMTLKCTNTSPAKCNYLDLTISVYNGVFNFKSYDKRRDFSFEVVNYPNLSGNIPVKPSYGVFTSQLIRFCHINRTASYFAVDAKTLVKKLINQGFSNSMLKDKYFEFSHHYLTLWTKYGVDITTDKYIGSIFSTIYKG